MFELRPVKIGTADMKAGLATLVDTLLALDRDQPPRGMTVSSANIALARDALISRHSQRVQNRKISESKNRRSTQPSVWDPYSFGWTACWIETCRRGTLKKGRWCSHGIKRWHEPEHLNTDNHEVSMKSTNLITRRDFTSGATAAGSGANPGIPVRDLVTPQSGNAATAAPFSRKRNRTCECFSVLLPLYRLF